MRKIKYYLLFLVIFSLVTSTFFTSFAISKKINIKYNYTNNPDDFYFVHITDTHILHEDFDEEEEESKTNLNFLLNIICDFSPKPAFVFITGDLVEWGGKTDSGALNYQAFVDSFYEKDDQYYVDLNFSIPAFFIPGNHDYRNNQINPLDIDRNLSNYHSYVDDNHIDKNDNYIYNYRETTLFFLNSGSDYLKEPSDWSWVLGDGFYDSDIKWFENALESSESENKIVLMHHPAVNKRNSIGKMVNVIARNRMEFIELCLNYDVEIVLAGHTHQSAVYDSEEKKYEDFPLYCSLNPTLFIQTKACKEKPNYRNISYTDGDFIIDETVELKIKSKQKNVAYDNKLNNKTINYHKIRLLLPILVKLGNANLNQMF